MLKSEKRSDGQDGRIRLRKGVIYLLAMRQNGSTAILKMAMPLLRRVFLLIRVHYCFYQAMQMVKESADDLSES